MGARALGQDSSVEDHDSLGKHDSERRHAAGEYRFFDGTWLSDPQFEKTDEQHHPAGGVLSAPKWQFTFQLAVCLGDVLSMVISTLLVFLVWHRSYETLIRWGAEGPAVFVVLSCALWILCLYLCGAYNRHVMGEGYDLYTKIANSSIMNFVMVSAASYFLNVDTPRSLAVFTALLGGCFTCVMRCLLRNVLRRARSRGECAYDALIIGSPEGIRACLKMLRDNPAAGYRPVAVSAVKRGKTNIDSHGHVDSHLRPTVFEPQTKQENMLRRLPFNSHLARTASQYGIKTVLVADAIDRSSVAMRALALSVESQGIELALSVDVADVAGAELRVRQVPGMQILTARLSQYTVWARFWKRFFDIVLSGAALIVLAIPMAIVAFWVHREDGGPAIYTQKRVGLYGKQFTIYKFRSMRTDSDQIRERLIKESGQQDRFIFKMKDDPRITKIGKFIRKTSIDELPQFFNVLKGDMSLVGPRPPLPEEVARYGSLYSSRLLVKPGITGAWQVSGRSDLSAEESERLDVSYVENWSLTGDFVILCKTVKVVLVGQGSY